MMSTTGRNPVIAAPTPMPVKPASEIGVSITRSAPKMHTRESRRISSASASRTACANVSSLVATSGINVLIHLVYRRVRRGNRKLHRRLHFRPHFFLDLLELSFVRKFLLNQPLREVLDGVPFRLPFLLFLFRPVMFAVDVPHVVSRVAIRFANQKRRPFALPRPLHPPVRRRVHRSHILPVHAFCLHSKRSSARQDVTRRCLRIMRIFRIKIVLADVDHRQSPQRRQVHHLVKHALSERSFAKKAHCYFSRPQSLRRKCRSRGDSRASSHDCIRPQVAGRGIGNVHGSPFATAIPRFFSEQLRKHAVR